MNETNNIIINNYNNYNNYNKEVSNIIMDLSEYMLNNSLLTNKTLFCSSNKNYEKNNMNSKNKNKDNSNNRINNKSVINKDFYISKKDEDKLFWCFYNIYDLDNNYLESNINNRFLTEKKFKISSIDKIKNNNNNILKKLKTSKITIENDLLNEKNISFDTFIVLCNVYELNIFYVKDKIYSKMNLDIEKDQEDEKDIKYYILYHNKDEIKITLNNQYNTDNYNNILKNLIYVENINKPLKNISCYKLKDLQDFSIKLNLPINNDNKKKTKKELYGGIHNLLNY
tara:strand:- start:4261 stop:5112 length:852 start_codon:yes stop_codon:yes gene_type:complete